jgi:hypothetical protein
MTAKQLDLYLFLRCRGIAAIDAIRIARSYSDLPPLTDEFPKLAI